MKYFFIFYGNIEITGIYSFLVCTLNSTKIIMTQFENSCFKRNISKNNVSLNSNTLCKGIKTSVYTNRLVVSSGITSLDNHLGMYP